MGFFRTPTSERTSPMWMGKPPSRNLLRMELLFFFGPSRRKETIMVAQEEEIDGGPEKKKPGASFSLRDVHASG